ncbi:hypothetical protein ASC97_04205 [Rhizobium sp. Root1203]|uniref:hypothetical protein n=1 Tax=Rhizobium sp. Root1203 TaxID=1736427 RepID=UPI00070BF661|nr:hypothetical protein [Rhizobium sp. Root1203]KQV27588.1 hypothetical protein ASC97_04205 [Rhizobium sp. Root1203]
MKKVTIDQFLTWAFTQELCKVGAGNDYGPSIAGSWNMMSAVAELGTLIDRSPNGYGVIPDYMAGGDPHADAVAAGNAVKALAARGGFEIGEGWKPFPEWRDEFGLIQAEVENTVEALRLKPDALSGRHVVNLVVTYAILGRGPDWSVEQPEAQMVSVNGKPLWFVMKSAKDGFGRAYNYEADGFDRKKQRPMRGAYRKYELSAPLRGAILSRLDWQLWQSALEILHADLSGRLSSNSILPFSPDRSPWAAHRAASTMPQAIESA